MLGGRGARDRPGVVDEDVDLGVLSYVAHEVVDRGAVAEVAAVGAEPAALRFDGGRDLALGAERRAHADDVRSRRRERRGDGPPDPAAAARDERSPPGEIERRCAHALQSTRIFIAWRPPRSSSNNSGTRSSGSTAVTMRSRSSEPEPISAIAASKSSGS